jgi:outer membrane lipopolysaccharide assembly protein LptE/RlpB
MKQKYFSALSSASPRLRVKIHTLKLTLLCAVVLAPACGYHVAGKADLLPQNIKTMAVPAFTTIQVRPKLARLLATNIAQELTSRTKINIVADPNQADAVLKGSLSNFVVYQTISDPVTGRATGAEIIVTVQITIVDRPTGKVLFTRPAMEFRERYEVSTDPQTYFDESGTAVERVARDAARTVVTGILTTWNF